VTVEPPSIEAVVFDLDGVVRHWDESVNAGIEDRHGLARGAILDAAFDVELGPAAVTGALDYDTWAERVGERIGCMAAVREWGEFRGHLDRDTLELVDAVRAGGCRVALLSNATTRLEEDLDVLGITDRFDAIFNTARLGVAKPDLAVYRQVVDLLGVPAERIVFTDDTPDWAHAATEVGLIGIPFTGVTHLREELTRLGVNLEDPPGV
jgi:putative hydrolase of the HAD superfamily